MKRWLQQAALLSLTLRLLFAAGFMPAAIEGGWLVTVCHQGLPEGVLHQGTTSEHGSHESAHHQHAHTHAPDTSPANDDKHPATALDSSHFCPLGGGLDQPTAADDPTPASLALAIPAPHRPLAIRFDGQRPRTRPPIRGPPQPS